MARSVMAVNHYVSRVVLAGLVLCGACGSVADPPYDGAQLGADALSYWPAATWRTARPHDVNVDESSIVALVARLRSGSYGAVHGLVIVRKGYLITEEYFGGWVGDSIHTMQSITKSVTSLLTGIAISRGDLRGIDVPLTELLAPYQPIAHLDGRKQAMTIRDVLTMRTGMDWTEDPYEGSPLEQVNTLQTDWLRFIIDWPMKEQPGGTWVYNSGGVMALGGGIGLAARMNTADYARQYLFRPIGITDDKWYRGFPDLLPHMGGGLVMTTRDLARLGYLVLRNGRWGGSQVVPQAWIDESTRFAVTPPRTLEGRHFDYGYLWWILPLDGVVGRVRPRDEVVITASGAYSQWLFIVPKYDLVVAINSDIESGNAPGGTDILMNTILPAMR